MQRSCTRNCTTTSRRGSGPTPGRGYPYRAVPGFQVWAAGAPGGTFSPFGAAGPAGASKDGDAAVFSVVELATGGLAGDTLLWDIDPHNRSAHVGISLRPACRGRGLGTDAVLVLCRYAFAIRGLHRLQLETLADNEAMIRVAQQAGFTREGVTRGSDWVNGAFADGVIFGLLDSDRPGT
jgi:RimJ/RimL family protein N-acetyltransferase